MESLPDVTRVFPKCWKCNALLAQCCCAASRNEREALQEYMAVREQLADLEGREIECKCGDFHMCDLCREAAGKSHQLRGLMEQWGDNWVTRLAASVPTLQPGVAAGASVPPSQTEIFARLHVSKADYDLLHSALGGYIIYTRKKNPTEAHRVESLAERLAEAQSSRSEAQPTDQPDALKADTLFGIYCNGRPESIPNFPIGGSHWDAWQRLADWLNQRAARSASVPHCETCCCIAKRRHAKALNAMDVAASRVPALDQKSPDEIAKVARQIMWCGFEATAEKILRDFLFPSPAAAATQDGGSSPDTHLLRSCSKCGFWTTSAVLFSLHVKTHDAAPQLDRKSWEHGRDDALKIVGEYFLPPNCNAWSRIKALEFPSPAPAAPQESEEKNG